VVDIPTRNNIGEHLLTLLPDIQKAAVVFFTVNLAVIEMDIDKIIKSILLIYHKMLAIRTVHFP